MFILPPPYLHRLYLQRGLFTELSTGNAAERLASKAFHITFPASRHKRVLATKEKDDSQAFELVTLEPDDPWLRALKTFCETDVERQKADAFTDAVSRSMVFEGYLRRTYEKPPHAPWTGPFGDSGLAVALGVDPVLEQYARYILSVAQRTDQQGNVGLDNEIHDLLERDNPGLIQWATKFMQALLDDRRGQRIKG
jgi:hypothetical protein